VRNHLAVRDVLRRHKVLRDEYARPEVAGGSTKKQTAPLHVISLQGALEDQVSRQVTNPNFTNEVWKGLAGAGSSQSGGGRAMPSGSAEQQDTAVGADGRTVRRRWQVLLSRWLRRRRG
jgi:hypothetical protein